ncbi:lamin tail domain-containing protein [Haladaptatus salinisoli]|uniref:lamin tail domain-containing protein n=1 Tax=Haladaptatus salinisoli TaxID=2884876 RepID=UPI001D0B86A3|nr:lamin tail domain-containing protein [Haladaptatus salinisoli]
MRPKRALLVLLIACLVVLAGCASSGPNPTQTSTTTSTDTLSSATTHSPPTSSTTTSSAGSLKVHYINVGQSASTLIVSPTGETMLIDSGDWRNDGEYVLQYLKQHNISRIDYLVTSHADADHIGGHAAIINYYETKANGIGAVYDPGIASSSNTYQRYLDAVKQHNVTLYKTQEGDRIPFECATVNVLGPPDPYIANKERNENSIVLKVTYGQTSFLLPGDAAEHEEQYLIEHHRSALNSTVLYAGHHGSRSSSSDAFLDAVTPQAVVISSAYDSQYGHPHEEMLDRLAARNIPTYWTAVHGNIVLESTGTQITVKTQAKAPTDPHSLRSASPFEPGTTTPVTERTTIDVGGSSGPGGGSPTTTAPTMTTSQPANALQLTEVHADAAGDDADNLNDEYIVLKNTGNTPLDLSGWQIRDEADHSYTVPNGVTLEPGAQITIHTGSGEKTNTDLYWGSGQPIWNNGGDTVIVVDTEGTTVLRETYQ